MGVPSFQRFVEHGTLSADSELLDLYAKHLCRKGIHDTFVLFT